MKIFEPSLIIANRQPDVIDEVDESTTYLGFLQNGNEAKTLIQRIQKVGTVTTFMYPAGSMEFNQAWADRAVLNYNYRR
jgi:hypothetical protein